MQIQTRLSTNSEGAVSPRLYFTQAAWRRLSAYVQASSPNEVSGFAHVTYTTSGCFVVREADDVFITEQTVTPGSADVTGNTYARALHSAIKAGRSEESMRLQWHSHGLGGAYHSATDMRNIESYGYMQWFISLVTNRDGGVVARLDHYQPHRLGAPMEVFLIDHSAEEEAEFVRSQISDLVTVVKPKRGAAAKH